jgi:hypothetical protein
VILACPVCLEDDVKSALVTVPSATSDTKYAMCPIEKCGYKVSFDMGINDLDDQTLTTTSGGEEMSEENWRHRSKGMKCRTCMWWVEKHNANLIGELKPGDQKLGRCRKKAPTLNGWPAVYESDWCGDHKLDETKL